ncbi:MAG: pilus assembly protein TadG-related protein [Geminicoccaceae bacterium]
MRTAASRLCLFSEHLRGTASRMQRTDQGGVTMIVGLSILPLVLILGLVVDGGLAYGTHSRLQGAVDAAALASARTASTEGAEVEADARMFFDANFPPDYLGSRVTDFDANFNEETGELEVNAEIDMPTFFMRVAGLPSVSVATSATAQKLLNGIELAMVLDVTGSMNQSDPAGGTKIEALKTASETLLDVIYGENDTVDDVSIAIVPYNTTVNLGSDRTGLLTGFDADAFGDDGWRGCVEARSTPHDQDDTPPSVEEFTAFLWPTGQGTGYNPSGDPNAFCPESEVLPLTAKRSVISDHIDDLEADGFTMTNVGFTWGWRTVSPEWRTTWDIVRVDTDDENSLPEISTGQSSTDAPVDYDHPSISKAIIFMTDGKADWAPGYYTSYGFLAEGRLDTTSETIAEGEVNNRLLESCELAKEQGIEVYTVMFDLNDPVIEADYRSCASSNEHFFDAPDGTALETAFKDIAGQLTSLRLTQ